MTSNELMTHILSLETEAKPDVADFFLRERDPVPKEKDELNHLQTSRGSFLAVSTPILLSLEGWIFIEKKMGKRGMESS